MKTQDDSTAAGYERLAARDAAFLDMEDGHAAMLLGAVLLVESAPLVRPDGTFDAERVRALVASRLHRVPRFRRRLVGVPGGARAWVDDPCFDLDYHVRHVALPHPGDERQLAALAGTLFSQRLDSQRPLWELWLVEGVAEGRCAVVCKMHHCLVDGIAGVSAIATLLLNPVPDDVVRPPRPWTPAPAPSALRVYVDEIARRLPDGASLVGSIRAALSSQATGLGFAARAIRSMAQQFVDAVAPATETPFNGEVGPDRRLAWARVDLAGVEEIRALLGGTLNDIVLAAVAGAVRQALRRRGFDVDSCDFRVLVPVSVRDGDPASELGNGIAAAIAPLPVSQSTPRRRLAAVRATMRDFKAAERSAGFDALLRLGDALVPAVASELFRLTNRARAHNMMVTNVPGPPVPLYLLGGRVLAAYPVAPVLVAQRMTVAVLTYAGALYWGVNADRGLASDADALVADVQAELDLLRRAGTPRRAARPRGDAGWRVGTALSATAGSGGETT